MPRTRYPTRFRGSRTVEVEIEIDATFSPFDPGVSSGPVEACYPPEGGELRTFRAYIGPLSMDEQRLNDILDAPAFDELIESIREEAEPEEPDVDVLRDRRRDDELTGDR